MDVQLKELANQLVDLGAAAGKLVDTPDGGKAVLIPDRFKLHQFPPVDPPEAALKRISGGVTLHDAASFVLYVNQYKSATTKVFAEPGFIRSDGQARVVAIFDYHEKDTPHHGAHIAQYMPRYSEQWTRWTKASAFEQVPFAEWIEENRSDISEPAAASLLDIVRTFKASKKVEYDSVVYQPNGDVRLNYNETTEGKGAQSSVLPERMTLGIPVYFRGERYAVGVWVRYRASNGKVVFNLKVDRPDVIEDDAFNALVADINSKTEIEAYLGRKI